MGVEWCQIVCGEEHTVGVTTNGQVFSWGRGQVGQLGHGENCKSTLKPKLVGGLDGEKVMQASCGSNHTVILTRGGDVYIWCVQRSKIFYYSCHLLIWFLPVSHKGVKLQ